MGLPFSVQRAHCSGQHGRGPQQLGTGLGIGSAVLGEVLGRCDRDGVTVRLQVLQGSAARRLYQRHGFVVDREDEVDVFMVRRR